jgi:HSP20 family protein
MLLQTDPFREVDRLTQQVLGTGTTSRASVMPMDSGAKATHSAWCAS